MSLCDLEAGWFGGVAGIIAGHPMDTIKVRASEEIFSCYKKEGVRGFFKGMSFPVLSAGALNAIYFGVFGHSVELIRQANGTIDDSTPAPPTKWETFIAGCIGGAAQLVVACPVDMVKIKLQTQRGMGENVQFRNPLAVLHKTFLHEGLTGCYKGLQIMFIRDTPSFGLYGLIYQSLLDEGKCTQFLAGGMAGVLSWASIMPFDVVKSRIQADSIEQPKYRGMAHCFRLCYLEGGLRIFFRGFFLVSLRAFPVNGITFVAYEYFMKHCSGGTVFSSHIS